jgi:hypothetical protein
MTASVRYTATLDIAANSPETNSSTRVQGKTTFVATTSVLVDTYIGPKSKRVYQAVDGKGLRTDKTKGSVSGSYTENTNGQDLVSTANYSFSSDTVKFDFAISQPGVWGSGTDIELTMTADDVIGQRNAAVTSEGVTADLTETGYLFSPFLMVKPDFSQPNAFDVVVESLPSNGSVTIFGPPPQTAPSGESLAASLYQLIQTRPELVWFGATTDERAGRMLESRFSQTRVLQMQTAGKPSDGTLTEELTLSIGVQAPSFRPYKG